MAWSTQSKNTNSWSTQAESNVSYTLSQGSPIGLLLTLTYANEIIETGITWDLQTKN